MNDHMKRVIDHRNWENQSKMGEAIFKHDKKEYGPTEASRRELQRYNAVLRVRIEARERDRTAEEHYRLEVMSRDESERNRDWPLHDRER